MRLSQNKEFQYLSEYFSKHAHLFVKNKKLYELGLLLVKRTFVMPEKIKLLDALIKLPEKGMDRTLIFYECGLLHYFQGKWDKAEVFFEIAKGPLVDFYLGKLALRKKRYLIAETRLKRFVRVRRERDFLRGPALLALAEVYLEQGNASESYLYAIKSNFESAQRAVLLHRIYSKTKEAEQIGRIEKILKTKYRHDPYVLDYLRKINQIHLLKKN